jgi:putative tricarboxylic transport membrane protein
MMGISPAGATPASFMSYGIAKRTSKNGDKFGSGEIEGVVAPETAAHAAGTAALLPMLSLGAPGSPTAAVPLGGVPAARPAAVRREGIRLGPDRQHVSRQHRRPDRDADLRAAVRRDPAHSILDHRADHPRDVRDRCLHRAHSTFDVAMMLVFGVIGFGLKTCNYPLAPMVLAIVRGDKAEEAFRQSLLGSQGGLGVFFSNGLVGSIMVLGLIALLWR